MTLKTLKQFSPTVFDFSPMAFPALRERANWFVAPCGTNRDADDVTRANWVAQGREFLELDAEEELWETHEFNH